MKNNIFLKSITVISLLTAAIIAVVNLLPNEVKIVDNTSVIYDQPTIPDIGITEDEYKYYTEKIPDNMVVDRNDIVSDDDTISEDKIAFLGDIIISDKGEYLGTTKITDDIGLSVNEAQIASYLGVDTESLIFNYDTNGDAIVEVVDTNTYNMVIKVVLGSDIANYTRLIKDDEYYGRDNVCYIETPLGDAMYTKQSIDSDIESVVVAVKLSDDKWLTVSVKEFFSTEEELKEGIVEIFDAIRIIL